MKNGFRFVGLLPVIPMLGMSAWCCDKGASL